MRVASIQMAPVFKDKKANLKVIASLVAEAARAGAELVVLPELCTTGYSFLTKAEAKEVAEPLEGLTFQNMLRLAKGYEVTLVWGMVIEEGGKLYNAQVYLDPSGKWEKVYKINRWGQDFIWASEGKDSPPIITRKDGTRVGLLICRDIRDKWGKSDRAIYGKGDADVVCFSANWGDGGFPAVAWMDFVADNKTALVVSNRYGREANNNFGEGGICVITAKGEVATEGLLWNQNCLVVADILAPVYSPRNHALPRHQTWAQ